MLLQCTYCYFHSLNVTRMQVTVQNPPFFDVSMLADMIQDQQHLELITSKSKKQPRKYLTCHWMTLIKFNE